MLEAKAFYEGPPPAKPVVYLLNEKPVFRKNCSKNGFPSFSNQLPTIHFIVLIRVEQIRFDIMIF